MNNTSESEYITSESERVLAGCRALKGCTRKEDCERYQQYLRSTHFKGFNAYHSCIAKEKYKYFIQKENVDWLINQLLLLTSLWSFCFSCFWFILTSRTQSDGNCLLLRLSSLHFSLDIRTDHIPTISGFNRHFNISSQHIDRWRSMTSSPWDDSVWHHNRIPDFVSRGIIVGSCKRFNPCTRRDREGIRFKRQQKSLLLGICF